MQTFQQLKLWLAFLVALAAVSGIGAQQELRQADHNRAVLPRLNFGRLYSRLFSSAKEKPAENEAELAEVASQRQDSAKRHRLRATGSSRQVVNLQIPAGAIGQQFFGSGFGQTPGYGHGHAPYGPYGYGYPDYNSIPGLQVYPQGYGFVGPDYYNYVNLNTDAVRQGYRWHGYVLQSDGFNDGRGQFYSAFAPRRQWVEQQTQQQQWQQPVLALDYGEEDEQIDLASEYDDQGEDDYADDVEEGDDYGSDDELWRQANADPKAKSQAKPREKRKIRRKAQRVAKRNVIN